MKKNNLQIIVFGATGALAEMKLFPAFGELFLQGQLPENFQIIGFGRTKLEEQVFRKNFLQAVKDIYPAKAAKIAELAGHVFYFQGQYDEIESFHSLAAFCRQLSGSHKSDQIAYFSVPPLVFGDLALNLSKTLKKSAATFKIIVEKPFGISGKSASALIKILSAGYKQQNVFLLDHYLGKRPIQSILKLRLENKVINLLIKGSEIAKITLEASEKDKVGRRIGYYDQVGAVKDMIQSHLLQLLALITMDIPVSFTLPSLQREKQNILSAVRFSGDKADLRLGQYRGYASSEGVSLATSTETFAAVKLGLDRRDWYDVPVYLQTGKKLAASLTRAIIEFKKMPFQEDCVKPNCLVFEMKPGESVSLRLVQRATLKNPDAKPQYEDIELSQGLGCRVDFCLNDYAALINDVIRGDHTYFLSFAEILAAWKVVDAITATRARTKMKPQIYGKESEVPKMF